MDQTDPSDRLRFGVAIGAVIVALPPQQVVSKPLLNAYALGLEGVPIDAIERAAKRALQECKFTPSPAELRELAGEMSPTDRAVKAWAIVAKAAGQHGEGPSLDFDDQAINATIRNLGGWEGFLAKWDEEQTTWVRKEFERVYLSYCRSGITAGDGGRLVGFHERSNRFNGYLDAIPDPLVIECHLPPLPLAVAGPEDRDEGLAMPELLDDVGAAREK